MLLSDFSVEANKENRRALRNLKPRPLPKPVQGILFDMCNILYDDTAWRRWVLQLLSRLGLCTNYFCFFRLWDRDFLCEVHCGREDFRRAFSTFLRCTGLSPGQIDEVEAACLARRRQLESQCRPLPGVRNTLWRLHQEGFTMGVICNSEQPAAWMRERLHASGIEKMFRAVVSSIDLKRCMPDAACYSAALETMQIAPDKAVFIGHDRLELAGAAALGMSTIAFNFDRDAQADVHINRFEELIEVLLSPLETGLRLEA
jgi:HAD superfamily hydrolase (TIGR01509 family)